MDRATEAQRMLCLAAVTYAGWSDPAPGALHDAALRAAVARCLDEPLASLIGRWELAWGPAWTRSPGALVDDGVVCVFRDRERPGELVIGVRGTNPLSGFDWLFGDFWVAAQVPWPWGDDDPRISASTALGLALFRHGRSGAGEETVLSRLWLSATDAGRWLVDTALALVRRVDVFGLLGKGDDWLDARGADLAALQGELRGLAVAEAIARLQGLWTSGLVARLADGLGGAATRLGDPLALGLLGIFDAAAEREAGRRGGTDLVSWLRSEIAAAPAPVRVTVTGHSKGGALAIAFALWLAETQGDALPERLRWDPEGRASVHGWSFAGPSPGNAAFAARVETVLGERCRRVYSDLDVVTHAWEPARIRTIAALYGDLVLRPPGLEALAAAIASALESVPLEYCHAGRADPPEGLATTIDEDAPGFVGQLVHQHLDAYLRAMALPPSVTKATFFDLPG
jgi:hypothetical protein